MSDEPKGFTEELRTKLLDALDKKWIRGECYLCGKNEWSVHGFANVPLAPTGRGIVYGAQTLPCAAMVCGSCGNTVFVNLIVAGVLPRE